MGESEWSAEFTMRFRMGEAAALGEVYARHAPDVARAARRFLGARGHLDDVEDVVQEVFSKALSPNVRSVFDGTRRFGPYLGSLARNLLVDWARKRGRELVVDDLGSFVDDAVGQFTRRSAIAEARRALGCCVARLPSELRRIYELRYLEGKTQRAVCATLGLSRQELRTRELHLLRGLRREITRKASQGPK
jgi:RNA polymerase sigma-70 factor (ECF subfamily)